jgi:hypothetical protein
MNRLLILLVIFFTGCSAPVITSNCDESADFSLYSTFSYGAYQASTKPTHPEYNNSANRLLIKQAITNELVKLGYTEIIANGDLMILYDIIITEMVDPRVDSAVIYKPWVDTKTDSFNYTEGLLVIKLVDSKEGNMIWQGSLSGILNNKPEKFGRRTDYYLTKLFAALVEHMQ